MQTGIVSKNLGRDLLYPPFSDRRFWLAQVIVAVVIVVHLGADFAQDHGLIPIPGFVWILLFFVPLVFTGNFFGLRGSLAIAFEVFAVSIPQELFLPHTATELWGAWSTLTAVGVASVLIGYFFEKDHANRAFLIAAEHDKTASYYKGHPLFGEHLLDRLADGIALVDDEGVIRYVNSSLEALSGYRSDELVGQPVEVLVPISRRNVHKRERQAYTEVPKYRSFVSGMCVTLLSKDEIELHVNISLSTYQGENREPWVIARIADDTTLWEAEIARREMEQRFQHAFLNNVSGMTVTDISGRIISANDSYCEMLGYSSEEIIGQFSANFTLSADLSVSENAAIRILAGEESRAVYTKRYRHRDGHTVCAEVSKSLARNELGEPLYFINSLRDVTEERSLLAKLSQQALHDPLTGLANRLLLEDRLDQAVLKAKRERAWMAVQLIDLDDFKDVNDTMGHQIGDSLLVEVARRLEQVTRSGDTLCRLGGDEFVYLCEGLSGPEEAEGIARRILDSFDEPFLLNEEFSDAIHISASIGVATCLGGEDCEDLLRSADTAMYEAKRQGKDSLTLFLPEMYNRVTKRRELVQDLRQSLASDAISMHYQPIVEIETGAIKGFEALMRWSRPGWGSVSPDVFIPLAEQSDLIFELGYLALRTAVREAASWCQATNPDQRPYVTVNLSPRQFYDPQLFRRITETLEIHELNPDRLVLEITEGSAIRDIGSAVRIVARLREIGIALAIDDFGTGYSSLSYFTLLKPQILKVDRSFVKQAQEVPNGEDLLGAIITIGKSLDVMVVAEGIETRIQCDMLKNLGYKYGQGYLFSPPVPAIDLAEILDKVQALQNDRFLGH